MQKEKYQETKRKKSLGENRKKTLEGIGEQLCRKSQTKATG